MIIGWDADCEEETHNECVKRSVLQRRVSFPFPAFILTYLIYDTVEKEHARLQRKQPGEFDHET